MLRRFSLSNPCASRGRLTGRTASEKKRQKETANSYRNHKNGASRPCSGEAQEFAAVAGQRVGGIGSGRLEVGEAKACGAVCADNEGRDSVGDGGQVEHGRMISGASGSDAAEGGNCSAKKLSFHLKSPAETS